MREGMYPIRRLALPSPGVQLGYQGLWQTPTGFILTPPFQVNLPVDGSQLSIAAFKAAQMNKRCYALSTNARRFQLQCRA